LIVKMQAGESMSLEQIQAFLETSDEVGFKAGNKEDLYEWVNQTLRQLDYRKLKRSGRGLVRRYVAKMTGLSRAQATRLLGGTCVERKCSPNHTAGVASQSATRTRKPSCWHRWTRQDEAFAYLPLVGSDVVEPCRKLTPGRSAWDLGADGAHEESR
jgi:hypothetical protein